MKRALLFSTSALAGLAGVVGLHGSPAHAGAAAGTPLGRAPVATRTGARAPAAAASTPASAAPSVRAAGWRNGTATGPSVQYGYGALSVAVTVSAHRISAVKLGQISTAEPYSAQLAAQVVPMLSRQVLAAQSANISGVSGATYTSEAYAQSLQAAIDKLRA